MSNMEALDSDNEQEPKTPHQHSSLKWWQWLLIYPTLAATTLGSIPTLVEAYNSLRFGVKYGQSSLAESQNESWRNNLLCSTAPFRWYTNEANVRVDGTICKSGDVLVRVEAPDKKTNFTWVPVKGLITTADTTSVISLAYAGIKNTNIHLASESYAEVVCQKFVADGRLLRRINTGQGCVDEIVNTYTGQVIQRNPAPCNTGC